MPAMTEPKFRPLTFGVTQVSLRHGDEGVQYLSAEQPLKDFPDRITEPFHTCQNC